MMSSIVVAIRTHVMGVGVKIFGLWCLIFVYMIIMRKSTTKGTSTTDKYYGNTIAIIGWAAAHPIYLQGNFDIGESKIVAFSVSNPLSPSLFVHVFFHHFPSKPNDKREQSNKIQNILTFNTHRKVNAIRWNQNNMDRNKYAKSCIILWNNAAVLGMYSICLFICFIPVKQISSRHNMSQWRQLYHTKNGYRDQTWKKLVVVFLYQEMSPNAKCK